MEEATGAGSATPSRPCTYMRGDNTVTFMYSTVRTHSR